MGNLLISIGGGGAVDLDAITAAPQNVLEGKVIIDKEGEPVTGSMPERGDKKASLNCGESYIIEEGHHSGGGKITANSLASQTVSDAQAGHLLKGKTAWVNGSKVTGTIESQGALTYTPTASAQKGTVTGKYMTGDITVNAIPANYKDTSNLTLDAAGRMLSGYTALGKNGTKYTGNIASQGALTYTPSTSAQTASVSGKYMTGNVTINAIPSKYKDASSATVSNNNQLLSGVKAIGSNGTLYTGSIASMNGGTYTPSGSQQTISCSGKKMNSNIIIHAIPSSYVNVTANQVVFNNGVCRLIKRVYPYYMLYNTGGSTNKPLQAASDPWKVSFDSNQNPLFWSTANYSSEPALRLLFDGSINLNKFTKFRAKINRRSTVEPQSTDTITIRLYDAKTKVLDSTFYLYSYYDNLHIDGDYDKTVSGLSFPNKQVFICWCIGTDYPDDPNGGNHFITVKYMEFLP